jgi:basic membrane protein A and related proteins
MNWRRSVFCFVPLAVVSGALAAASASRSVQEVQTIAIAAPEKANDYGWNQQGVTSARNAASGTTSKLVVADGIGYANTEAILRRMAARGADLILAHASGYSSLVGRVAESTQIPILGTGNPKIRMKGLVADVEANNFDGAYLAGIVAAKTTKAGRLGIVRSADIPDFYKFAGGFVAGARSVDPNIKFSSVQVGDAAFADASGGKRAAQTLIASGADVILGMGDGASFGYLSAIQNAKGPNKVWFVDVIGDKRPIDKKHVLLTSVVLDWTKSYRQAIADVDAGTFGAHNYTMNLSNGVSVLKTPYIPASVWSTVQQARKGILAGKVHVPVVTTRGALAKLIAGSG